MYIKPINEQLSKMYIYVEFLFNEHSFRPITKRDVTQPGILEFPFHHYSLLFTSNPWPPGSLDIAFPVKTKHFKMLDINPFGCLSSF